MNYYEFIIVISFSYIVGAIPFSVITAQYYNIDILNAGSNNAGATNVKRCVGNNAGNLVFLMDMLKGFIASVFPFILSLQISDLFIVGTLCLFASIIGHLYSIFIKFKGGKGVATTIGGMLMFMTQSIVIGTTIWLIVFYVSKYAFLSSIFLIFSLPISAYFFNMPLFLFWFSLIVFCLIIFKHWSNIIRYNNSKEFLFKF